MEYDGQRSAVDHAPTPERFASPLVSCVERVIVGECVGPGIPTRGATSPELGRAAGQVCISHNQESGETKARPN